MTPDATTAPPATGATCSHWPREHGSRRGKAGLKTQICIHPSACVQQNVLLEAWGEGGQAGAAGRQGPALGTTCLQYAGVPCAGLEEE